jgi:peptidoglycan/xylan/chitin deacetylase (PgdA/CDA1 family)
MNPSAIPVLTYHSVSDEAGHLENYRTSLADFALHVEVMSESGRSWVTARELALRLAGGQSVDSLGVVTFDDPMMNALPVLIAANIAATVFSRSDLAEDEHHNGLASMAAIRSLAPSIEVGSHSIDHPQLDCLNPKSVRTQLRKSRSDLAARSGRSVDTVAYPHGYASGLVRREAALAGYVGGFGVGNSFSHIDDRQFLIGRVLIEPTHTLTDITDLVQGRGWPMARRRDSVARFGWRQVRRGQRAMRRSSSQAPAVGSRR